VHDEPDQPRSTWWRDGALYQVYPRSFQDSNGDGIGDLRGITQRLDHLNGSPGSLGVDGIWISPFYPSPMADFGYDIEDYCDIDPAFGTLADFDELVAEAHRRAIRVIIDIVPNHTSDRHPWFAEARTSRASPKRDWYVWADPKPDGSPPNDWRSHFPAVGPSAWELDAATGQYYLHSFHVRQPDLNWWNPEVRAAFDDILRFWLDRGVDGFRIDVANKTVKARALDAPYDENPAGTPDTSPPADEVEGHAVYRAWRRILDEYGDRMAVAEVYWLDPERLVRYYGDAADELHLAFNFSFLKAPWSAAGFRERVETFERLLPAGAWPDYTLSNHDISRAVSRYASDGDLGLGRRRARLAALMLLTLRGTPFLYYGEEIGMADGQVPVERVVDVAGRDPARTPMQWDGTETGGFTTGRPWLPLSAETSIVNVEAQRDDPRSMFALYRELIGVRRASRALRRGTYQTVEGLPDGVFAYRRDAGPEGWLIALNMTGDEVEIDLRAMLPGYDGRTPLRLSTDPDRPPSSIAGRVQLQPEEGLLIELST
jgi:alpha-glucosidase